MNFHYCLRSNIFSADSEALHGQYIDEKIDHKSLEFLRDKSKVRNAVNLYMLGIGIEERKFVHEKTAFAIFSWRADRFGS